jgi:hypothetical protein
MIFIGTFVYLLNSCGLIVYILFLGVHYETYHEERHRTEGISVNNNIADSIYRNLPKTHIIVKIGKGD